MKRILAIIIASVLCVSLFAACGDKEAETVKINEELNNEIIGSVNKIELSQADYNMLYKMCYENIAQYAQQMGNDWYMMPYSETMTTGQFVKESAKSQLLQFIASELLLEEKYGIKIDEKIEKAAEKAKKEYIKNLGGKEKYAEFLGQLRTTDAAVAKSFVMMEAYDLLKEKVTKKGEGAYVSDEETLEAFKSEKMRVQHILISTQEQTDPETGKAIPARTDEEAQKIVKEVIAKLEKGEDFDKLIDKYDEDPGMKSGEFYVFGAGEMVPEFEEASKNLEIGKFTTEGVKTSYGYHIIKRYDIDKDIPEFKEFKDQIMQTKLMELLDSALEEYDVKWEEEKVDKYVFEWVNEMRKEQGLDPIPESADDIQLPTEEQLSGTEETKKESKEKTAE